MGEFVLRSMDARFSGSVDADGFPYSRQPGFGHSKSTTASPGYSKEQEHVYVRSYSDRLLKCDLTLDMLSENEKIKIIENLVKIQNDGTLEVDAKRSALIASELSEIDAFGSLSRDILEATSGLSKSVPKLKIAILVVGTRGDDICILQRHLGYPCISSSLFHGRRPTNEFPHPLARMPQSATYRLSYLILDLVIWWGTRGFINEFRKKLKLAPIAYFSTYHGSISHLPTGYMWSPHLMPKPNDWGPLVDVVGYCFLNLGTKYQPPQEFSQWLQQGLKPIYIGFGSMPLGDEKRVTSIILDALRETGQRGIISRGWGDLGSFSEVPVDVFILEDCPHDWLFPRCAAVVHHGGAGTTAAGLVAGCPTTVVPFFGDQFFWGERIHAQGVGPAPIPIAELTVEALSNAIGFMLDPEVKSRTMELAIAIGNEDGVAAAVDSFHRHLPAELPLAPPSTDVVEEERLDFFQWFSQALEKCCFPFNP
uniref:Erythromycin biosynthesis protein CIII-like C-terminal domain-containing protein n=1 Tax=Leersia perrieri TaxID=77586 RepID=A0A0D9V881_9ORYZ